MDAATEKVFALVSAQVSAGDGIPYDTLAPQPPAAQLAPVTMNGVGSVSAPMLTMLEVLRRCMTNITTPSTALVSGGSAGAVAVAFGTATPSGIAGMFQGMPFVLSAAGTLSGSPTSLISTASNQIRKVLVAIGMSAMPVQSSLALAGGTVQFTYGSAMLTSANAITSGGPAASYFDYVPLPLPSANEVPVGWLNVPNGFATSAGLSNTMMWSDYRALQGLNLSAMLQGLVQP